MRTQQEHVKDGSVSCPFCGSEDLYGASTDFDAGGLYQECSCRKCGKDWHDVYRLVGFTAFGDDGQPIPGAGVDDITDAG